MNRIQTAILLLVALFTSACATVGGIAPLDAGTGRVFQASFDSTLRAAREALVGSGFRIEPDREVEPGTWSSSARRGCRSSATASSSASLSRARRNGRRA